LAILRDILYKVALTEVIGNTSIEIDGLALNSNEVKSNYIFVATKGTQSDGHKYIDAAIDKGALAIVCEQIPEKLIKDVVYLKVKDSTLALAVLAANFYNNPSHNIKLVGITGTNGKSTIATLLFQLFTGLGYKCGLISTIEYKIFNKVYPATHTTPNVLRLNELLDEMVDIGCEYCFMEVSSHALAQQRVAEIKFSGGVFTNLSHDHLDFHKDFNDYLKAKKSFFDGLGDNAFALTNVDDKRGEVMLQNTKATKYTYALKSMADYKTRIIENALTGLHLRIDDVDLNTLLVGEFNAYNITAVYATAILLQANKEQVLEQISTLIAAEGRFEYIYDKENNIIGIIDYAHTPDALKNVLETISAIRTGNEKVITVVGAGGDRDKAKRPKMANIACELSDKVILTSDNPRTENIEDIIDDMMEGLDPVQKKKVIRMGDRKEAIRTARILAEAGDIIGVYGKGHEKYQEINKVRHPFNDKEILLEIFKSHQV